MNDYLEIDKKFKDVKDIADYIDDVEKLRHYYATRQYQNMLNHIQGIRNKYFIEAFVWNTVNNIPPMTYEQYYINAENFLCAQGAKLIAEKVHDFKVRLTKEEAGFIETLIQTNN